MLIFQSNIFDQRDADTEVVRKTENVLFSDAYIIGDFEIEELPFSLINIIGLKDGMRGAALLRHSWYEDRNSTNAQYDLKTKSDFDTGQSPSDDIGCLVSLLLGIRVRVSGETKYLRKDGQVWSEFLLDHPRVPECFDEGSYHALVAPWAKPGKTANLHDLEILASIGDVDPEELVELVRGAKLFSNALWLCEIDPPLAWLLLVSALETYAFLEFRNQNSDPVEALQDSNPDLLQKIKDNVNEEVLIELSKVLTDTTKSTKKIPGLL